MIVCWLRMIICRLRMNVCRLGINVCILRLIKLTWRRVIKLMLKTGREQIRGGNGGGGPNRA